MKLSKILFDSVKDMWEEATRKEFVVSMALGDLDKGRYRYYMIQDYYYIIDYIDILELIDEYTEKESLKNFLKSIIKTTKDELQRVHIPFMKELGITEEIVAACKRTAENIEYTQYFKNIVSTQGVIPGLVAMLHCSWIYAYVAQTMLYRFRDSIEKSDYKGWFEAYACKEYVEANQMWIDVIDRETIGISDTQAEKMCDIFRDCAGYENKFWDMLTQVTNASGE